MQVELNTSNQSNSVDDELTQFIDNSDLAGSPCEIFPYPICKQSVGDIFLFLA